MVEGKYVVMKVSKTRLESFATLFNVMSNFPIAINPYRRPIVIKTDIIAKIIAGMLFLVEKKVPIFNIPSLTLC